jgi:hypothetical protein
MGGEMKYVKADNVAFLNNLLYLLKEVQGLLSNRTSHWGKGISILFTRNCSTMS